MGTILCVTADQPPYAAAAHGTEAMVPAKEAVVLQQPAGRLQPCPPACSNEYVAELGKLEAAKDDMIGGGQPVELAVELLRCASRWPVLLRHYRI